VDLFYTLSWHVRLWACVQPAFFEFLPIFFTSLPKIRGKIANYSPDFFCMSGGGRFCRVIRHIADHFWINTADYVMAERNLP
jgi:hypothetical protein